MKELENSTVDDDGEITTDDVHGPINGETNASNESAMFSDDIDSSCSTPYVSAPSSPGRGPPLGGFYYSAPSSPMHFLLSHSAMSLRSSRTEAVQPSMAGTFEFDFSARLATNGLPSAGSMSSADELFFNGQIRPMKLSTHLQRPQRLAPLLDLDENVDGECDDDDESGDHHEKSVARGRDKKLPDRSFRRRTRSMSPMRTVPFQWREEEEEEDDDEEQQKSMETTDAKLDEEGKHGEMVLDEATPSESASSSRSSSVGRNSKRWIFLKEFLYRSKSEGRNNGHKFWSSISFSPVKDKKPPASSSNSSKEKTAAAATTTTTADAANEKAETKKGKQTSKEQSKKAANGKMGNRGGKRRVPPSAHELHYTANRAQAEEMRKKTFLPYRQGLLGCLGFSSKSYGAMSGFARALNPVYSR